MDIVVAMEIVKFTLTRKDIIALNKVFDSGNIISDSSLTFALNYAHKTENWTKALAYMTRAILLDHVFEEANKRTAVLLIKTYIEFEGYHCHDDIINATIKKMLQKNITSIRKIEETHKVINKERLTFTIDKSVASNFRRMCKHKGFSMSAKVEQQIKKILEEESVGSQ